MIRVMMDDRVGLGVGAKVRKCAFDAVRLIRNFNFSKVN